MSTSDEFLSIEDLELLIKATFALEHTIRRVQDEAHSALLGDVISTAQQVSDHNSSLRAKLQREMYRREREQEQPS